MAIVIGDIHGNVEKVQAFLDYKPEVEHVALGDYLDSFCETQERQLEALNLLLGSDAVLLWGNHDLHYTLHPPFVCSGFQHGREEIYCKIIQENIGRFRAAVAVDGWLCTHAGVSEKIVRMVGDDPDPVAVAAMLNQIFADWRADGNKRREIFDIGRERDGGAPIGGIFWFDHLREYGLSGMRQLFGHTAWPEVVQRDNYVCLDTTNVPGVAWVWDTEENRLVKLSLSDRRKRCVDCLMLHDFLDAEGMCTDCGRGC